MTIIKLKGGLGNQLFQYAFGRLTASHRGEELKIDKDILGAKSDTYRAYGLDNFNIKATLATPEEVKRFKYPYGVFSKAWRLFSAKILRNFHIGYEPEMLETKAPYLDGFFQSYKYLEPIRTELLQEISLKEDLSGKYGYLVLEMALNASVAVHIRRGDYVSDAKTKSVHFICDLDYYQKTMALIKERIADPVFYVFSDDITWAKENLKGDYKIVFVSGPGMADFEELMLMSKCEHNIIANSSFSFWGAWLNQNKKKIVIAPGKWNNELNDEYKDLLPGDWVRI